MKLEIKSATKKEIDWVNEKYDEVEFPHSNLDKEVIAIASIDGERVGIGRLINLNDESAELGGMYVFEGHRGKGVASKIVEFLLGKADKFKKIFCLPFANLEAFYGKYGFKAVTSMDKVPQKIIEKHKWANDSLEKEVLLFCLETN